MEHFMNNAISVLCTLAGLIFLITALVFKWHKPQQFNWYNTLPFRKKLIRKPALQLEARNWSARALFWAAALCFIIALAGLALPVTGNQAFSSVVLLLFLISRFSQYKRDKHLGRLFDEEGNAKVQTS